MAGAKIDPRSAPAFEEISPVEKLRRWEQMGGVWRIASETSSQVTVSLLRCDGGEEVERLVSDDPGLIAFVAGRSASDD